LADLPSMAQPPSRIDAGDVAHRQPPIGAAVA
jgi:hypothetical protein